MTNFVCRHQRFGLGVFDNRVHHQLLGPFCELGQSKTEYSSLPHYGSRSACTSASRRPTTSFFSKLNHSDKTSLFNVSQSRHFHVSSRTFAESHYDVLGVPSTATQSEIKTAFYRLSKEFHPDRNPDSPAAVEKFKRVSVAYEVVGNPEQRRRYDAELRPEFGQRRGGDGNDFDDQSGAGFSTVRGDKWRGEYDKSAGFRKTPHDEAFERWMHDVDERRGYNDARRRQRQRQQFDQREWDEWYENHYQEQQHQHPFWEQEMRRREQQQSQEEQTRSDERSRKRAAPRERIVYERTYTYAYHRRRPSLIRILIYFGLFYWILLASMQKSRYPPDPRYFRSEPVDEVTQEEFIRRYYEKTTNEERSKFSEHESSELNPPSSPPVEPPRR